MAHGTGDMAHVDHGGGARASASAGTAPGATPRGTTGRGNTGRGNTGRVATGRFATADAASPEAPARRRDVERGPHDEGRRDPARAPGDESERERQARIARALRAAEGETVDVPDETDWRTFSFFGAGVAIGALLGAGAALLLAPATGFETRMRILRSAQRTGDRIRRGARRRSRDLTRAVSRTVTRDVGRGLVRSRWAAEDAWERRRRRGRDD